MWSYDIISITVLWFHSKAKVGGNQDWAVSSVAGLQRAGTQWVWMMNEQCN